MSRGLLPSLALGVGMIVVAFCNAATAAGGADGGPSVTGSMYNGNNAEPPDFAAHEVRMDASAEQANPERQNPVADDKGGNSAAARAGGGG